MKRFFTSSYIIILFSLLKIHCANPTTNNFSLSEENSQPNSSTTPNNKIQELIFKQIEKIYADLTNTLLSNPKQRVFDYFKPLTPEECKKAFKNLNFVKSKLKTNELKHYWEDLKINFKSIKLQDFVKKIKGFMEYQEDTIDTACFTVDFADKDIGGSQKLLAQEEMMFLETFLFLLKDALGIVFNSMPEEYCLKNDEIGLFTKTPLFCKSYSDKIYKDFLEGNVEPSVPPTAFENQTEIEKYFTKLPNITYHNILAMDAPQGGIKSKTDYDQGKFNFAIKKLINGFKACKEQAKQNNQKKVHIITGAWGTGAFQNHKETMYILQVLIALVLNQEEGPKIILQIHALDESSYTTLNDIIQNLQTYMENKDSTSISLVGFWEEYKNI